MPADYTINLAKDLTSTPAQRVRFHRGMLAYLVLCAAALVCTAYASAVNIRRYLGHRSASIELLQTARAVSGLEPADFQQPAAMRTQAEEHAIELKQLKGILARRVQLLPVLHGLFNKLPEGVVLQSLSANGEKMVFGLLMPPVSEQAGDTVRKLTGTWEADAALMARLESLRPMTGERRTQGSESVYYVQFECVLRK